MFHSFDRLQKELDEKSNMLEFIFKYYNLYEKPKEKNTDIPID